MTIPVLHLRIPPILASYQYRTGNQIYEGHQGYIIIKPFRLVPNVKWCQNGQGRFWWQAINPCTISHIIALQRMKSGLTLQFSLRALLPSSPRVRRYHLRLLLLICIPPGNWQYTLSPMTSTRTGPRVDGSALYQWLYMRHLEHKVFTTTWNPIHHFWAVFLLWISWLNLQWVSFCSRAQNVCD